MAASEKEIAEEIACFEQLKSERGVLDAHLQECADYILPRKNDVTRVQTPGAKKGVELYDSTAQQSAELLAAALHSMLTNPAVQWFELTSGDNKIDDQDPVRAYLQECTNILHNLLNSSNFQTEVHELYLDVSGWCGTAIMEILEDDELVVRFGTRHIAEAYVRENNKGFIDTVYRNWKWPARTVVQEFGEETVGPEIGKLYKEKPDSMIELLSCVKPRMGEYKGKIGPAGFPFAHLVIAKEFKRALREGGFRELPYVVPRWSKASGETYGRSPGMKILPDAKMANEMMKTIIKAAQKTVDPPVQLPDDGYVLPIKLTPGGINYKRSGMDPIAPIFNDTRIDFGQQIMEDVRRRIRDGFYVSQLQLMQGPQMTATEVNARLQETLRFLGPMLGRMHSEFLSPLLSRVFSIAERRGKLPKAPDALRGHPELAVRYSSQVAKAQRISEGENILRAIQTLQPFYTIDPSVADNFDGDAAARYIASRIYGIPQVIIRNTDDIEKMREKRAEAQAKLEQLAQQQHMADIASKVGPVANQANQIQQQAGAV
jgi:hypothetical protein